MHRLHATGPERLVTALALGILAAAAVQSAFAQPRSGEPARSLAISDVTVIDVLTGRLRPGVTVLIQGERIAATGSGIAIPKDAARVLGTGKFLLPGLWDMHSHHQGTGADWLDLFVAKGVIGTRDMGG